MRDFQMEHAVLANAIVRAHQYELDGDLEGCAAFVRAAAVWLVERQTGQEMEGA